MSKRRAWWQIPLWSPTHFIAACGVVLVAVFLAGRLSGTGGATAVPSPSPSQEATPVSASAPSTVSDPEPPSTSASSSSPTDGRGPSDSMTTPEGAADAFVAAWSRRYDPAETWRAEVVPLSTPSFARLLSATDPLQVPATRPLGTPRILTTSRTSATVRVGTDAGPVQVSLQRNGETWLVSGIEPIDEGR